MSTHAILSDFDARVRSGLPRTGESLTDTGLAERLLLRHGHNLKFCPPLGGWFHWNGKTWELDKTDRIFQLALDTVRAIYSEAAEADNPAERKRLAAFAMQSESRRRVEAAIALAAAYGGAYDVRAQPGDFDRDPWVLNVQNGLLDLKTGGLRPHDRGAMTTRMAGTRYNPEARHELWEKFRERVLPDPEVRDLIQRAVGASLVGDPRDEKLYFCHGPEATGKSTFLRAVEMALGDYSRTADFETFLKRDRASGAPRNDVARLAGARFVKSLEVDEGQRLAEGLIKALTGGDVLTARFLFRESFEFRPTFTLWLAANHRPRVNADDGAIWRRIVQVPFITQIPEGERDPAVKSTLSDVEVAGPAILAWAVKGCLEWQQRGLDVPAAVQAATSDYRRDMDTISPFLEQRCVVSGQLTVGAGELYGAYRAWASEVGERPLRDREFKERLISKRFTWRKTMKGAIYEGLGLAAQGEA